MPSHGGGKMSNSASSKGNPATHRMGNKHREASRAACWQNSQKRKAARIELQHQQEIANRALRKSGLPVPWQVAEADRAARREAEGVRERWAKGLKPEQLPAA